MINEEPRSPLVENGVLYPFAARRQEYRKVDADETSWQYFADSRYDFQIGNIDNELLVNANYEDRNIRFSNILSSMPIKSIKIRMEKLLIKVPCLIFTTSVILIGYR